MGLRNKDSNCGPFVNNENIKQNDIPDDLSWVDFLQEKGFERRIIHTIEFNLLKRMKYMLVFWRMKYYFFL